MLWHNRLKHLLMSHVAHNPVRRCWMELPSDVTQPEHLAATWTPPMAESCRSNPKWLQQQLQLSLFIGSEHPEQVVSSDTCMVLVVCLNLVVMGFNPAGWLEERWWLRRVQLYTALRLLCFLPESPEVGVLRASSFDRDSCRVYE